MSYDSIKGYISAAGYKSSIGYESSSGFSRATGSTCNLYTFKSTDTDSLQLGSAFTGNLKVQIKAPSETGLHPDIITGRQGAFVSDTWMQYEIEAVALTYIVDATFNGRVAYAKDNVWFNIDMGADNLRYYYGFDGVGANALIETPMLAGQKFSIMFSRTSHTGFSLMNNTGSSWGAIFISQALSGTTSWTNSSVALDGVTLTWNSPLPIDGLPHLLEITLTADIQLHALFSALGDFAVWDIKIDTGSVFNIPADDGPTSGGILANTGTGPDAILVNEITGDWYESDI